MSEKLLSGGDNYSLQETPTTSEIVRSTGINGSSSKESSKDPRNPSNPASMADQRGKRNSGKGNLITVHGYCHKQGKRVIKGPIHKSWKRRYFALEKSKIYYFQSHLDCRQYFTTRNVDLVVGAIELKDALQLRASARLDLPHKGFEIITKRRTWVLCPETEEDYFMWFEALEQSIISQGSGNLVERDLPNVRIYPMKGIATYRFFYILFILAGLAEIFGLVFWFSVGIQPCDEARRSAKCDLIIETSVDKLSCQPEPFNGVFDAPEFFLQIGGVDDVKCFASAPILQWVSYFSLFFAEILTFFLGVLYYLGMWRPVRRGARYLDEFQPALPEHQWPKVDVMICHYSEPSEDTIDTLAACMNMHYPPELLHIWVLDDGYCKAKYTKGDPIPNIELNKGVLETAGDVRQEVAQFMFDRLSDPANEDMETYAWRKLHSSANLPTPARPRVVARADCAVGSFRDDYKYEGFPHVTFVGRVKPAVHFSKAGNINNCLYNEGADGKYCVIFDNDMQPHPKFVLATLPFFFDDENQDKIKYGCATAGCTRIAKICCASCKIADVPEDNISYCSRECFDNAMHVQSALHRRQVGGTVNANVSKANVMCTNCGNKVNKHGQCSKCHKRDGEDHDVEDIAPSRVYSDEVADNSVAFVQTPQYFRDCVQLSIGDPLGHRNATFYDSIQTGQDGFDCASFAGTNAIFRRQALDSVGGIQYGSLTEDAFTGQKLLMLGWKALYFRKDFEGDSADRIRLAEGLIPDSVASSLAQRKRWAKGNFQIFLHKKKDLIDPEWKRPEVGLPSGKRNAFMRKIFYWNNTIYPLGSFGAVLFYYIIIYFLFMGYAPLYMGGLKLLIGFVPKLLIQGVLSALANRTVANNDVVRSQEAWFAYAFIHCLAVFEAIWWKITGKEANWANTGGIRRGSFLELLNVLVFFGCVIGSIWSVVRFFAAYDANQTSHGASLLLASILMGLFVAWKLGPMVRMSIQEYFGWSYHSLTDHGNFLGNSLLALGIAFIALWVYVENPSSHPY